MIHRRGFILYLRLTSKIKFETSRKIDTIHRTKKWYLTCSLKVEFYCIKLNCILYKFNLFFGPVFFQEAMI